MEMTISSEQLRKVAFEIAHTQKLLEKARGYAEDLQDNLLHRSHRQTANAA